MRENSFVPLVIRLLHPKIQVVKNGVAKVGFQVALLILFLTRKYTVRICPSSLLSQMTDRLISKHQNSGIVNAVMLQGRRVRVRIGQNDTVQTLKRKIHEASCIPVEIQCIVYKKNRLEDDRTLQGVFDEWFWLVRYIHY